MIVCVWWCVGGDSVMVCGWYLLQQCSNGHWAVPQEEHLLVSGGPIQHHYQEVQERCH